eukprot:scaffold18189_cov135-Isochrysis_galbana.AAC.1
MRCLRPCTPPVRLFSVYSLRVQPSIRQRADQSNGGTLLHPHKGQNLPRLPRQARRDSARKYLPRMLHQA